MGAGSLQFHATPGRHTNVRNYGLDVTSVEHAIEIAQGLLVHDLVARDLRGAELPARQSGAIHLRNAAALLALARDVDPRPLDEPRDPGNRVGGRCNAHTLLTVALLRSSGIPARARCGVDASSVPGWYEDHWVVEYWDGRERRWILVNAMPPAATGLGAQAPRRVRADEFLSAGHAWRAWRRGELDAGHCGLTSLSEGGAFWIARNLRLDLAALNKVEMLPWDILGTRLGTTARAHRRDARRLRPRRRTHGRPRRAVRRPPPPLRVGRSTAHGRHRLQRPPRPPAAGLTATRAPVNVRRPSGPWWGTPAARTGRRARPVARP